MENIESLLTACLPSASEVEATINPFIVRWHDLDDPEWLQRVDKIRRRYRNDVIKRRWFGLFGRRRTQIDIDAAYNERWRADRYKPFEGAVQRTKGGGAWIWNNRGLRLHNAGSRRLRIDYLMRLIEVLRPSSVLEVGCGEGFNLLLLANRFPDTQFSGVELTRGGHEVSIEMREITPLPALLVEFSPHPLRSAKAHANIDFRRGNAGDLPFTDGAFDLVFTSLALEQMEELRERALAEIARVTGRYGVFIEPFREYNDKGIPRDYIYGHDYFQGQVADLTRYGFRPLLVEPGLPSKVFLQQVLVVAERTDR